MFLHHTGQNMTWSILMVIILGIAGQVDTNDVFVIDKTRIVVMDGAKAVFPCKLKDPSIEDVFLKHVDSPELREGLNVTYDKREGIIIERVQLIDNGKYYCEANKNGMKFKSLDFTLVVKPVQKDPPKTRALLEDYVRIVGERFEVSCIAENIDFGMEVIWHHKANSTVCIADYATMNEVYTKTVTLSIDSVTLGDTGNFTCEATNQIGTSKLMTHLQVVGEPYIRMYANESTINVKEGEDVNLSVSIEAYPELLKHEWKSAKKENMEPSTIITKGINRYASTYTLQRMKPEEAGQYTFSATNVNNSPSNSSSSITFNVFVHLDADNVFDVYKKRIVVREGEKAVLPCRLIDPSIEDVFLKRVDSLQLREGLNVTYNKRKGITIHRVQLTDEGNYYCEANKSGMKFKSSIFTLLVNPAQEELPKTRALLEDYVRIVGERFEVSCIAENIDFDMKVIWHHKANSTVRIANYATMNEVFTKTVTLSIDSVTLGDTGNFTCEATNQIGTSKLMTHLQVVG